MGFLDLFWCHGPAVHAYLARRGGRQAGRDLLGEVWLRAFRGRSGYDADRFPDPRPWPYGIARNTLHAHWKQRPDIAELGLEAAISDAWPDVDSRLEAVEALPAPAGRHGDAVRR
jgi:RNA polymerase sigma-70 factor (ECF subfamily)